MALKLWVRDNRDELIDEFEPSKYPYELFFAPCSPMILLVDIMISVS